jgi:hypothetical protein
MVRKAVKKLGTLKDLTKYVVLSILFIVLYTITEFTFSIITNIHHDTLTNCVYAFFGTELALCGFIKIFKIRRNENDNISG